MTRLLMDMDGVMAHFEARALQIIRDEYPGIAIPDLSVRTSPKLEEEFPPELRNFIRAIYAREGFFLSLDPIPGAIEAIHYISDKLADRVQLWFCTSPLSGSPYCVSEKLQWIARHFGPAMTKRVIIIPDKTLVRGDYLVDDWPNITGSVQPTWEHIAFSHPYNIHHQGRRIDSWANADWFFQELHAPFSRPNFRWEDIAN